MKNKYNLLDKVIYQGTEYLLTTLSAGVEGNIRCTLSKTFPDIVHPGGTGIVYVTEEQITSKEDYKAERIAALKLEMERVSAL